MGSFGSMIKGVLKRKEGGTLVGNTIRTALNSVNPMLGRGTFMLKEGQTLDARKELDSAQAVSALGGALTGGGAGASAGVVGASVEDNLTAGGKASFMQQTKTWLMSKTGKIVWMSLLGVILVWWIWKKMKKSSPRRKY